MDCLTESLVLEFLEGPLEEQRALEVEAHMATCADCRELVSMLARGEGTIGAGASAGAAATLPARDGQARGEGAIVSGRFRLERIVGSGGMGEVWAARHLVTRKVVALKFLHAAGALDRKRLYREARASALVAHPNVLEIRDVIELEDGTPVLVMDLLVGRSLREHLAAEGRLTLADAAAILAPAVSAVGAAHALGIVHRDLKPDNVFLVARPGGGADVKVLDFGVAKLTATEGDAARTAALTADGELVGTPFYMSPEQTFGEPDVDHRTDLWAFGVILYECLAGRRPFEGSNVGQVLKAVTRGEHARLESVRPELPSDVTTMVGQLLSVSRGDRPADLRELHGLLARYGQVSTASFGPAAEVPWAPPSAVSAPRRAPWIWAAAATVLVGGAGAALWATRAPSSRGATMISAPPRVLVVAPAPVDLAVRPTPDLGASARPVRRHKDDHPTKPERLPGGVYEEVPF